MGLGVGKGVKGVRCGQWSCRLGVRVCLMVGP